MKVNGDLNFILKPEWFIVHTNLRYPPWNQNDNLINESEKEWKCFPTHTHTPIDRPTICDICLWHWHTEQNLKDSPILVTYELNWIDTACEAVKLWAGKLAACVISALYSKWTNLEHPRKQRKSFSTYIWVPRNCRIKMFPLFSYQKQRVCTSTSVKCFH